MMSSTQPDGGASPAAPRAGADLRAARERLDWPIEDVSAALRIRMPHLEALEEGRIDLLPGNAYAVGFLRTYARALGLDPDEIVRRFKAEAGEVNRRTELVFPAPMPQRGLPAGAVILLGIVLAIGAYAGWYRLSGEGRLPAETVASVPERLAPLAEQATSPSPPAGRASQPPVAVAAASSPQPAPSASGAQPAPPASQLAVPQAASGPAPAATAVAVAQPTPAPEPPVPAISPTSAAAASVAPPPAALTPPSGPAPDQPRIVVQATADAWLQVRDRNGSILLNRILHSGETWPVPARPNLVLTTGNAGGTQLVVDGAVVPVPGGPGAVRRDLPLDPDLIKDGKWLQPAGQSAQGGTAMQASAARPGQ